MEQRFSIYLGLLGHGVNEEIRADVIHIRDKNGQEVRGVVLGVNVLLNPRVPVLPGTYK